MGGGAYEIWKYRKTIDFIANYRCTSDVVQEIAILCFCDVPFLPNTEQNLLKLPYQLSKIVKYRKQY